MPVIIAPSILKGRPMVYDTLLVEKRDSIATITLNRPEVLNAMNLKLVKELQGAVEDAEGDDSIRCLILTG
ncbi:MAG: enoyl-CoA hydratase/isomerase family protein, partial [SAR202 cluster bacterium]|nr:enoyl-CoA hydratase/isomerase family protein [SAR202 cluster bacterium]